MAAADVQQMRYSLAEEGVAALDRTESQVEKQLKVHQVQQRLEGQQQPVRELLAAAGSLARDGDAPAEVLQEIIRQQKTARNIGEDLLEDMLKLDSLGGLYQEDREVRKLALAQLDDLVDQVDSAKAQLLKRRKELEAGSTTQQEIPKDVEEYSADSTEDADAAEDAAQSSPTDDAESPARSVQGSQQPEEVRCRLKLRSQEMPQGYLVSAEGRGVAAEDLDLQLDGDLLRLAGVARPTVQDAALLRRRLRREPTAEDYAAFGFGRFQEAIRVPADVDASKIQASCRNGQLQLLLPRRPRQFPRGCRTARPPMFPMW